MRRVLVITTVWMALVWTAAFAFAPGSHGTGLNTTPLDRWDAAFYRGHATGSPIDRQDAFPPLYGWLVAGSLRLTGLDFGIMSAILSAGLTIAAVLIFTSALAREFGQHRLNRRWIAVIFFSSPAAFVLLAPYPASLLACLAGLSWLGILRRNTWLAMIPAILAPLAHATGLAVSLASLAAIAWRRKWRDIILATALAGAGIATAVRSGLVERFIDARTGFSLFPGIPFWRQGAWYLETAEPAAALGTVFVGGLLALALASRVRSGWLTIVAVGLTLLTITAGAWTGLPRFLLPAFLIPLAISQKSKGLQLAIIVTGFGLQLWWLRDFVQWRMYV